MTVRSKGPSGGGTGAGRNENLRRISLLSIVRRYRLDLFAILWVPYALLVHRFWFVTDDAFISFRYARNFALGHGLRYNLGDHTPVEGYSNFLWVMICSIFEFFRIEITLWPLLLSAVCGSVLLWLVFDLLRRRLELPLAVVCLATLSLGCFPPFALWSTSGLATMPFALLVYLTFERLIVRRNGADGVGAGIAGLLLALLRLEGIGWALVIAILALISRRLAGQRTLRPFLVFFLIVGIGYAIYFGWRYSYYQMLLPNTAYAKATLDLPRLERGFDYVVSHVLTFLTPIVLIPGSVLALRRKRLALGLPVSALAWGFFAYAILTTGDFMPMGRFLMPAFALQAILLAWILEDLWSRSAFRRGLSVSVGVGSLTLALLPAWNVHLIPGSLRIRFDFRHEKDRVDKKNFETEYERWRGQRENTVRRAREGEALRSYMAQRQLPDECVSYVAGAIGASGYYSDMFIHDRYGLVTREVADREIAPDEPIIKAGHDKRVSADYFLDENPTILMARLVQEDDPEKVARSWRGAASWWRQNAPDPQVWARYVVDFARVDEPGSEESPTYLFAWVRLRPGESPKAARATLRARAHGLERDGHLPQP